MTITTYSQNFEDVMLWRALGNVRHGFYIDVGAAWPVQDSVTRLFVDRGWRGINVEPNPDLQQQLREDRPDDVNLGVAVADRAGELEMDIVESTGLSTLDEGLGSRYRSEGREVTTVTVQVVTLADLWDTHVPPGHEVHFLKIDVEGFEGRVIDGADWDRHRPWVVLLEATQPTSETDSYHEWEPSLLAARYRFVYEDGINRFYVADEHAELIPSFRFPPNIFDGFVTFASVRAEQRAAEAEVAAIEARHERTVIAEELRRLSDHATWLQHELDTMTSRLDRQHTAQTDLVRRLGGLESLLSDRERALASTTQLLHAALHDAAQHARAFHEAHEALEWHRQEDAALRSEVGRLMGLIGNLEHHISEMYRSTSWRVAKPIRLAGLVVHDPRAAVGRVLGRRRATSEESGSGPIEEGPATATATTTDALTASRDAGRTDVARTASHLIALLRDEVRASTEDGVR